MATLLQYDGASSRAAVCCSVRRSLGINHHLPDESQFCSGID